ncbi:hypothetical protein FKP32DRAFT_1591098 [Trametes sanguinea]|nr:hypothetical protein FKP32DRAFT_1593545 [Trametes sanguinea]KAI9064884.1 hypothetical protein FKP32DRAFT_1591098 [Trametes sanguinea]
MCLTVGTPAVSLARAVPMMSSLDDTLNHSSRQAYESRGICRENGDKTEKRLYALVYRVPSKITSHIVALEC